MSGLMPIAAILLAPFAWLLDMQISYAMVKWACEHDRRELLLLMPLGSLMLVGVAAAMSWSTLKRVKANAVEDGGHTEDRSYFLAIAGIGMSALFALLILTSVVPRYVLSPCE
jgi:hypothetical protein